MGHYLAARTALAAHPDVTGAEIVRLEIDRAERVIGVAEVSHYVSGSSLREYLWCELGDANAPDGVLVVARMPRVDDGVDLIAVSAAARQEGAGLFFHPPSDQLEADIAATWAVELGLSRVSVHDDFIDIGGDSGTAARIAVELERWSGTAIDVHDLLDAGTVRQLAQRLRPRTASGDEHRRHSAVGRVATWTRLR